MGLHPGGSVSRGGLHPGVSASGGLHLGGLHLGGGGPHLAGSASRGSGSASGGGGGGGLHLEGKGSVSGGVGRPPSPPVKRMTDRCKNITLPQTSFAVGKTTRATSKSRS